MKDKLKKFTHSLLMFLFFIIIWKFGSNLTLPIFLPSPESTLNALVNLFKTGQLGYGLLYSFLRITVASLLSMGVAIPVSLLIYGVNFIKNTIMPVVSFLRYIPVTAFSPLLILWFGIGEKMKISFIFIATFVYLLPSVLLCFDDVSQELIDTGRTLGMRNWETITEILLPASLPSICNSFLMMYGIGWTYCAIVEATNAKYGLGFIIAVSAGRGKTAVVFASIIAIMVFSFIFDKLGHFLINKIFAWRFVKNDSSN